MNRLFVFAFILLAFVSVSAQSRRVPGTRPAQPPAPDAPAATNAENQTQISASALYVEAENYVKRKIQEYNKKRTFSEELYRQTLREQKQMAAKYAAQLAAANAAGADLYYLGQLHVLAENPDAAAETMKKFLSTENAAKDTDKAQTARAVLAIGAARKRSFDEAENWLKEYLKNSPVKTRERVEIERELSEAYWAAKNYDRAAFHAESALLAAKPALSDPLITRPVADVVFDVGMKLVDIHTDAGADKKAEAVLEDLRETASLVNMPDFYAAVTDRLITFLIEAGRKPEAMERYKTTLANLDAKFKAKESRDKAAYILKTREPQYKLLGDTATELVVERWLGEKPVILNNSRGRVVLLNFWAHWCATCYAEFPVLSEWLETYRDKGFDVVGVTRYYGTAQGFQADKDAEIAYVQKVKQANRMTFPIAVGKGLTNHQNYAAASLPTTILIDKKGVVRYVSKGLFFEKEVERFIKKLLAEN